MSQSSRHWGRHAGLHHIGLRQWVRSRLGGRADADDIAQESWLRAGPALARGGIDNAEAYLKRVASNLIVDDARLASKRTEIICDAPERFEIASSEPNAEALLIERERMRLLSEAIDDLPPRCRDVFLLRKQEGLSSIEIGKRLGIGRNMVDTHLRSAMMLIAARIGEAEA